MAESVEKSQVISEFRGSRHSVLHIWIIVVRKAKLDAVLFGIAINILHHIAGAKSKRSGGR